jgi:hypothetical protein
MRAHRVVVRVACGVVSGDVSHVWRMGCSVLKVFTIFLIKHRISRNKAMLFELI